MNSSFNQYLPMYSSSNESSSSNTSQNYQNQSTSNVNYSNSNNNGNNSNNLHNNHNNHQYSSQSSSLHPSQSIPSSQSSQLYSNSQYQYTTPFPSNSSKISQNLTNSSQKNDLVDQSKQPGNNLTYLNSKLIPGAVSVSLNTQNTSSKANKTLTSQYHVSQPHQHHQVEAIYLKMMDEVDYHLLEWSNLLDKTVSMSPADITSEDISHHIHLRKKCYDHLQLLAKTAQYSQNIHMQSRAQVQAQQQPGNTSQQLPGPSVSSSESSVSSSMNQINQFQSSGSLQPTPVSQHQHHMTQQVSQQQQQFPQQFSSQHHHQHQQQHQQQQVMHNQLHQYQSLTQQQAQQHQLNISNFNYATQSLGSSQLPYNNMTAVGNTNNMNVFNYHSSNNINQLASTSGSPAMTSQPQLQYNNIPGMYPTTIPSHMNNPQSQQYVNMHNYQMMNPQPSNPLSSHQMSSNPLSSQSTSQLPSQFQYQNTQ